MLRRPSRFRDLTGLMLAAVGIRLFAGWWTGQIQHPATWEYETLANHLLAGEGYWIEHHGTPYHAFTLPLYPIFCAIVYSFTRHSQIALLCLQCFIGAVGCLHLYLIGRVILRRHSRAMWAAGLLAIHPGLVIYASRLHPLTIDSGVLLWMVWTWLRLARNPSRRLAFWAGLSTGIAMLARGTIVPFLILAAGWLLRRARAPMQKVLRALAVTGTLTGIIVMPWLIRNAVLFHNFPIFQTTASEMLWRGNNPHASGSAFLSDGRTVFETAPAQLRARLAGLDEIGQSDLFLQEAQRFITGHPAWALRLFLQKLTAFWWFSPQTGMNYPGLYFYGYFFFYTPIFGLGVLGLWRVRRRLGQRDFALLVLLAFMLCVGQCMFYVEGRHRWTIEPFLLLFSTLGAATVRQAIAWRLDLPLKG